MQKGDIEAPPGDDAAALNQSARAPSEPQMAAEGSVGGGRLKRQSTYLDLQEDAPFRDGWREFLATLTWTSYLFVALALVNVCLVWAYCGWSVNRPGGSIEESLHIALALAITAAFFFYFVLDGIMTENAFDLLAACVLDALVLARVLFYVIAKKRRKFAGRITLLSLITALQVVIMFLAIWTVVLFGWRIFSRLLVDFRKRDARQRTRLYLSRALFLTLEKLDLQFLIIMTTVAIVIWVKNHDCEVCREPTWFILGYNSVLFIVNFLIAGAAWFALKYPHKLKRNTIVVDVLMPLSLIQPIANIAWEFKRHEDVQNAKASMAVVCGLFIAIRLCLWVMMHLVKYYADAVKQVDQGAMEAGRTDRGLQPLMRGAWLGKPSARKPRKRRFFQLSADGASLRWSWRKYVRLFYLEAMECDHKALTLTLHFTTDPDLVLMFPDATKFQVWQAGLEAQVGALMSPGAPGGAGPQAAPQLTRPSVAGAAAGAEQRHANRNFLRHMVGIVIRDKGGGVSDQSDDIEAALPMKEELEEPATPPRRPRPDTRDELSSTDEEEESAATPLQSSLLPPPDKKVSFDPTKLFDFGDDDILAAIEPDGGGLMRLASTKGGKGVFSLPSGVRGGGLEVVQYEDLEFGKLLGAGAEGEVYAAWWQESMVAVKRFHKAADSIHELRMHTAVGACAADGNVVALRGYCRREDAVFLVMEYFPRGTLDVLIHNTAVRTWSMEKLLPMVKSMAAGIRTIHRRGRPVLHRDLKPGNIFVGAGQTMKLGDFGMSRYVDLLAAEGGGPPQLTRLTPNVIGTAQYAAPELMNEDLLEDMTPEQRYLQADIYSFGVTLWELLERKRPYKGMDPYQIQTLSIINPEELKLPPVRAPDSMDARSRAAFQALGGLVDTCTPISASARPSIQEVFSIICKIEEAYSAPASGGKSIQAGTSAGANPATV